MKLPCRKFLHLAAGAAALPAVSWIAWAQTYPARPVAALLPSLEESPGERVAFPPESSNLMYGMYYIVPRSIRPGQQEVLYGPGILSLRIPMRNR
jgi:hypothetical protein